MSGPPLPVVNLATIFIQGPAYGMFLVLFTISTHRFVRRARADAQRLYSLIHQPLFLASVAMVVSITADFIVNSIRTFLAFVYFFGGTEPALFYSDISHWTTTTTQILTQATLIFGDSVLVYRVAVIYEGNRLVVAIPFITLLASIGLAIAEAINYHSYKPGVDNPYTYVWGPLTTAPTMTTLVNNIVSSGLILFRVWKSQNSVTAYRVNDNKISLFKRVGINLIQSAGLYVAWGLAFQVTVLAHNSFLQPMWDSWAAVTGVAFMLLIMQTLKDPQGMKQQKSTSHRQSFTASYPVGHRHADLRTPTDRDLIVLQQWEVEERTDSPIMDTASTDTANKQAIEYV